MNSNSKLSILSVLFFSPLLFSQKKECFCTETPEMNGATISCKTINLKNGGQLYWQYNCEKIWLTLENKKTKKVVDELGVSDYGITYRIGYQLIKEYQTTLLFRAGCGAAGPCSYYLLHKNTGNIVKEFPQLIQIDTDILFDNPHSYPFDFVVYLSGENIVVYFVETKKIIKVPFNETLENVIPENNFIEMRLKYKTLNLTYLSESGEENVFKIDLSAENR